MATTNSVVNINDIPERYQPYRDLLLQTAFGRVYTPQALQQAGIPGAGNLYGNVTPTNPTVVNPTVIPTAPVGGGPSTPDSMLRANPNRSALQAAAELVERSNRIGYASGGPIGYAGGGSMGNGRLANSAAEIEASLGGDVNLGPGGSPIGGFYPGLIVSPPPNIPTRISTGTQTPPPPTPPAVTPPPNTGGIINTPPGGPPLTVGNPNPTPPPTGAPGGPPGTVAPPPFGTTPGTASNFTAPQFVANRPGNFAGSSQAAASGFNPAQYADDTVASQLARQLGAQNVYTNTMGPGGPPSQATLSFGGDAFMNAGLVNNAMQTEDPGLRQLRLNGLREEIRSLGGTPGFKSGGAVRLAAGGNPFSSMLANQPVSPTARTNNLSGGTSPFGGGLTPPATGSTTSGTPFGQPQQTAATRSATPTLGVGTAATTTNPFATTPPPGASGVAGSAFQVMQPYQAYQGQRVLGMGANMGQVGSDGVLQVSDQTRQGIEGLNRLQTHLDPDGGIRADRDSLGNATTNFGVANDIFDTSGRLAIRASQQAEDETSRDYLRSTFGDTMRYLQQNPNQFQAGDITLGQLTAPQLDAPMGISPSQLTTYQMAGPRLIDNSQSNINPLYVGAPQVREITADARGTNVSGQGYNAALMDPAGRFIDPNNPTDYMSPFQSAVTDQRRAAARRAFDESKQVRDAQAVRAGAFGGGRQAVVDAIANRDLANQLDSITAEGTQAAYENAQQQFERDRQARLNVGQANQNASNTASQFTAGQGMQASLANQDNQRQFGLANLNALLQTQQLGADVGLRAGLANQGAALNAAQSNQQTNLQSQLANQRALQEANQVNLNAALATQELGANQALTAQQANQNAGLTAGQANLNSALTTQNLARNSGLTAAQANQQTRLAQNTTLLDALRQADQLQQQAAQGNASNRLNALQSTTNSALAANTIGQSRADLTRLAQAMELQRLQALQGSGAGIDARTQQAVNLGYQDFINQQNYVPQQINWLQSILNGTPMGFNQEQVMFQPTNTAAQIGGLATAGAGALTQYLQNRGTN